MEDYNILKESDVPDIDATIEALREAWRCAPEADLSELLDSVTPEPLCEMTNADLREALNNFILQNQ